MAETSPNKLARNYTLIGLFLFAAPSILLQLWTGIYQTFDTAIATNFNSTATLSAINIVYPAQAVVEAIAFLFSGGSAALLGKLLGEKKTTEANKTFTCVLLISTIIATVWGFAISFAGDQVWYFMGADAGLAPVCTTYWNVHRFFMPLYTIQLGFQMWLLTAGKPTHCMVITILGGLVTLGMDVVYQGTLGLGTTGAALGFGTGSAFAAIASAVVIFSKSSALHYDSPACPAKNVAESCKIGLADFIYSAATGFMTAIYNIQAMKYFGADGVAVAAIFLYVQFLFVGPFIGFGKGATPIISYQIGENNPKKIHGTYQKYRRLSAILIVVIAVLGIVMMKPILLVYGQVPGDPVYTLASQKWILFASCAGLVGINICIQNMLTAFNDTMMPLIISTLRSLVLPIALLLVLPMVIGGDGVWLALTVAEAFTAVVSFFFLKKGAQKYGYNTDEGVELPEEVLEAARAAAAEEM